MPSPSIDLKHGHQSKKEEFTAMKKVLMGERGTLRSKVGEVCSSVEEQVDCLIDHASDPNVLGRTWVGWESWV